MFTPVILSFSILLFAIFLWFVHCIISLYRIPSLLRGRYRLFRLRDELRRLYILVQCQELGSTEFHDEDFIEIETRINNAVNILPLLSRRFIYLYMEGPKMKRFIEEKEKVRQNLLERYTDTPIGKSLAEIDGQISDTLYDAFCLNSPIYVAYCYIIYRWRSMDYQTWREVLPTPQLLSIEQPIADLTHARLLVGCSRLLANWSKVPS